MIDVQYEPRKPRLRVSGHAGYAEYGKDIVCSAVSSLVLTLADYIEGTGTVSISENGCTLEGTNESKVLFDFVYHGLERIGEQYPDNLHSLYTL